MSVFNLLKQYPELLDLLYLDEHERQDDLNRIFKRDIEDNPAFTFRDWNIYPIKTQGQADMGRLFKHLTCEETYVEDENGKKYGKRVFDIDRSQRLHWINFHIKEMKPDVLDVFTIEEKDSHKRKVRKTYIYDKVEEYVIVLEQQRSKAFYLLTAYHLNKIYGKKSLLKKMKKKIDTPL